MTDRLTDALRELASPPPLESDPVGLVHRRRSQQKRRTQLVAGGVAVMALAAVATLSLSGGAKRSQDDFVEQPTPTPSATQPTPDASASIAAPSPGRFVENSGERLLVIRGGNVLSTLDVDSGIETVLADQPFREDEYVEAMRVGDQIVYTSIFNTGDQPVEGFVYLQDASLRTAPRQVGVGRVLDSARPNAFWIKRDLWTPMITDEPRRFQLIEMGADGRIIFDGTFEAVDDVWPGQINFVVRRGKELFRVDENGRDSDTYSRSGTVITSDGSHLVLQPEDCMTDCALTRWDLGEDGTVTHASNLPRLAGGLLSADGSRFWGVADDGGGLVVGTWDGGFGAGGPFKADRYYGGVLAPTVNGKWVFIVEAYTPELGGRLIAQSMETNLFYSVSSDKVRGQISAIAALDPA